MKNVLTIFKKEFYRVMSDRRLIFTSIILPGLAIFIMYSLIGDAASGMETDIDSHRMIIYTENMPTEFRNVVNQQFDENPEFYDLSSSSFELTRTFGIATALVLLFALVSDLLILPYLIKRFEA